MFNTLESTWDRSARRGWSTAASFGFQALALSLLLAIPFFWIQGPPRITWLQQLTVPVRMAPADPLPQEHLQGNPHNYATGVLVVHPLLYQAHPVIGRDIGSVAPPEPTVGIWGPAGPASPTGVLDSPGTAAMPVLKPAPPSRPLKISHRSDGDLIYKVQPAYPSIAREARIQGPVQLSAIVSKMGTIERLAVVSGHPLLARAAVDAVKQWRYRPYLLNDEPIEIDMEITVNFVLSQ